MLQFIEKLDSNERNLRKRIDSDFICNRGLLKRIALAFSFFDTIDDEKNRKTLHLATKFENCMIEDEENSQVTCSSKIKVVNRLKIRGTLNVFSCSETDAMDKENKYIEIKLLKYGRDKYWLKNRALNVYLQVYLCNIHLFLFGYRLNERYQNDKVHQIELVDRNRLLIEMIQLGNKSFTAETVNESICFLYDTLSHIQKMLYENDLAIYVKQSARAKFRFEYISSEDCEFVPEEFLEKFE
ncbi:unnamed protein product [Caenorhabditis angaria]|uniref:Decapping nuclease n=1 Tax=Caenorhabditis angaria TaxID=860376 RepID=A0A9P1J0B9_9PELO|nr:unnamed protein product [Caenorhabditis angaria]